MSEWVIVGLCGTGMVGTIAFGLWVVWHYAF
jgi:hypothetical protein